MEEKILRLMGRKRYLPSNIPEFLKQLRLESSQQQELQSILKELERTGQVARIKGNRYILPREADLVPGRIQITRGGRGFLLPDAPGQGEVSIVANKTGTAMYDDRVLVRLERKPQGKRKQKEENQRGEVVRVLERRRTQFVGTLKKSKQFLYVIPDDPRLQEDIYVPPAKDTGRPARVGDKVVVELTGWESRHVNPEGVITEVLGPPTAEGVDMLAVLRQYDLPLKFPRPVLQEVKKYGKEVTAQDREGRIDCRDHDVITIDPADAKDFDDAFSLTRAPKNRWKLWVHIADVSHYVKPGSALDQEAHHRGNSTYLVDRVIPMLPEALSNELCSLKPHVDRLSKCVEFLIDDSGKILRSKFYPAVIHSKRRYSYEEAFEVLQSKSAAKDETEQMLKDAGAIAMKIRQRRFANGSLDLDFPETKIRLDDKGRVSRIEQVDNDESHQLIEEFMLLANEAVAGRLMKVRKPTIYRVHESPDPQRLQDYREEILSHDLPCGNLEKTTEVQKLLKRLGTLAIGAALKIGFLRSLMRARYAVEPLGHYGLAKEKYCHFTSPIRRYADLIVHRSLFDDKKMRIPQLIQTAEHISTTERNSADAERDSKDVKMYAYLKQQLDSESPHTYQALITDVRNFGLFIDVPDIGVRGVVPLSGIDDDFYEFDSTRVQLIGRRSGRIIKLGDLIEVQVEKVDTFKKEIDFRWVRSRGGKQTRSGRGRGGNKSSSKKSSSRKRSSRSRSSHEDSAQKPNRSRKKRSPSPSSQGKGSSSRSSKKQTPSSQGDTGQSTPRKKPQETTKKRSSTRKRSNRRRSSNRSKSRNGNSNQG